MTKEKRRVTVIDEGDFTDGRYEIQWREGNPLNKTTIDVEKLTVLIESWAMGKVPDKTIALEAPRVLAQIIEHLQDINSRLGGLPF